MPDHKPPLLDTAALRHHRLAAGHSERSLARTLGTTALHLRRLEHNIGHGQVTLELLHRLAAALNTTPAALLANDAQAPSNPAVAAADKQRALTIAEARHLHAALHGQALPRRGPAATTVRHLELQGLLTWHRSGPTVAGTFRVAAGLQDELDDPPRPRHEK